MNTTVKFGVIWALIAIILSLVTSIFELYESSAIGWVSMLIGLGIWIYGLMEWRKNDMDGYATFGEVYGASMKMIVIYCVIVAAFTFVSLNFIFPDQLAKGLEIAEENMYNQGMTEEQVEMGLSWSKKIMTPLSMTLFYLIGGPVFGAMISWIPALAFKKEKDSSGDLGDDFPDDQESQS